MKNIWIILTLLLFFVACTDQSPPTGTLILPAPAESWWVPPADATWQIQYTGTMGDFPSVDVLNLDLYETSAEQIAGLNTRGYHVICYFSAGSLEEWRADVADFPDEVLGRKLKGWRDERWLDIRRIDLLAPIMQKRLDLALEKGCDAVDPDNVNAFENKSGFDLSAADQLTFNRWLAAEAHSRGLGIGLKNDLNQIAELKGDFDFAVNEQCFAFDECDFYQPFVDAGKAVFQIEYDLSLEEFCPQAEEMGFQSMRKTLELGEEWEPCWLH